MVAVSALDRLPASLLDALGPVAALDVSLAGSYLAQAQARASRVEDANGTPLYELVGDGVAVIRIQGLLARTALVWPGTVWFDGYDRIAAAVLAADAEPSVRARVMRIDSPGGAAAGCFEAVRQILGAERRTPLLAFADERACSGAIALAMTADEFHLPPEGEAGSIGTIFVHTDLSRALENAGIKKTAITDPSGKADAWPYWPLTDEAKATLQESVSATSATFYELVASRRGLTTEDVRGFNARTFVGRKAVEAGLANGVLSWSQVISRAEDLGRQKEQKRMKEAYSLLGLPATASAEEVDKAALAAKPLLDLGRKALEMTGAPGTEEAKGTLAAWKTSAGEAAQLRADAAATQAEKDQQERDGLYVQIAQREPPGSVWNGGDKTKGAQPWLAEMSLPALRSYVASRPQTPALRPLENDKSSVVEPTDEEVKAYAKANGIKNEGIARAELRARRAKEMV